MRLHKPKNLTDVIMTSSNDITHATSTTMQVSPTAMSTLAHANRHVNLSPCQPPRHYHTSLAMLAAHHLTQLTWTFIIIIIIDNAQEISRLNALGFDDLNGLKKRKKQSKGIEVGRPITLQ